MAGPGGFQAGYQEIEGRNLGYLQVNGRQMFALAQVLSHLFKDIPRTTISKKMETLKIKSRRCDLLELRTLKAIRSVPTRAVQCSLISKEDLQALCASCRDPSPGERRRQHPRLRAASSAPDPKTAPAGAGGPQGVRISAYSAPRKRRGPCYRPAAFPFFPGPDSSPQGPPLLPAIRRGARTGSKQGTSAGYSSDSDSSLDGSSSSDSSEEGGGAGAGTEEDGSCSSASDSDSSGDSVQSIRYRQAALPGPGRCSFQRERARGGESPGLQPDHNLMLLSQHLWAGSLPSSGRGPQEQTIRRPEQGIQARGEWGPLREEQDLQGEGGLAAPISAEPGGPSLPAAQQSSPSADPRGDWESAAGTARKEQDLQPTCPNNGGSLGLSDQEERTSEALARGCKSMEGAAGTSYPSIQAPAPELAQCSPICIASGPQQPSVEPRREHFDRLIRQSKLWCYAKGFSADGQSLRLGLYKESRSRSKTEENKSPNSKRAQSSSPLSNKAFKGNGSERNPKRRRLSKVTEAERQQSSAKEGAQKRERKKARKGNPNYKRVGNALPTPVKNVFSLIANFPCTPSLVVGNDGDLCPAYSLGAKKSLTVPKTHPVWRWQLGGNAIPVPPSLKFRSYPVEDL
ncbi:elongin BC and Polycomb repressive complex 2-associated protein [Rhinatrema bivittatum]|uniref:elongin BC and Polycomb repressive complex 2-associated protein n=1 Tax=Rhinatrema bivittatum TaxID=194408 RepID=UPI00112D37A6|nr:elongin BC and Polycomb repressive complex 2-associated protein [Rhinatrema bivittatum]